MLKFLLSSTEALQGTSVKSDFTLFFNSIVGNKFIDSISHPGGSSVVIFFLYFFTVLFWILLLHSNGGLLCCKNESK